ncbi:rRNA methylase [Oleiphilus messinensis]|uniref:tRNA (cytidine/uridine-2'-O-)-methyltransferase TrmJ n=1 Tax=Oleiphilus messinensis TaxID=141451 RepID=A0A1Y0I8L2_9GAMM|nr:RNA methyltransferase [Oleiphilus messinensis]ARU56539.1 rRNA methylase [Oleiphilus messinensis]
MQERIRVVLMETSHPGNIGAVARAMKNMDVSELVLVRPDSFPDPVADARSSGALDILASARVVEKFEDAVADCSLIVGTSARGRSFPWPVLNPRDCALKVLDSAAADNNVALVFGREDRGLSNEELQRCHYHVHIPANPDYSSLNLAMAVQVILYEIRMNSLLRLENSDASAYISPVTGPDNSAWDDAPATFDEVEGYFQHLEKTLVAIGFHDPEKPRQLMARLRRIYQRCHLDKTEVNILRGILKATNRMISNQRNQH